MGAGALQKKQELTPLCAERHEAVAVAEGPEVGHGLALDADATHVLGRLVLEPVERVDDDGAMLTGAGARLAHESKRRVPGGRPLDARGADLVETVLVVERQRLGRPTREGALAHPRGTEDHDPGRGVTHAAKDVHVGSGSSTSDTVKPSPRSLRPFAR